MNKTVEKVRVVKRAVRRSARLLILFVVAFGMSSACLAQDYQTRITQIDQRIFDCKVKIQQLEREKESAVEEMRQGLFCSECLRSKSEIERATRESFAAHLQRVHGHAVANPQMLADKAAFYDRQIAALQKQIADLEKMKSQLTEAARELGVIERQRAAAEQQRKQREQEQERLRQMQAQQEKLRQERDRIVNKANAKAESYRQAGQAAADGIKQIGDILAQKMEHDQLEREQERYDRQMEALDEKIRAQEGQVSRVEKDQSVSTRNGDNDGGFRLPAPVQLQEPPSEEQIARGQTGIFSPIRNPGEDLLLAGGGKPSDRSMFDDAARQPYQPENRLSDFVGVENSPRPEVTRTDSPNAYNSLADDFFGGLKDSTRGIRDTTREVISSDAAKRYAESILTDAATGEQVKPVNTAIRQWVSQQYWRYTQRFLDNTVYATPPEQMDESDRLWLLGPRDIIQHGANAILKKDPREAEKTVRPLDDALKKFQDDDDLFKP